MRSAVRRDLKVRVRDLTPGEDLPESHALAVLGRMAFLLAAVTLVASSMVIPPRLIYSYHAQHFAAFYVLAFGCAVAFKKARLLTLVFALLGFAIVYETLRSLVPLHAHTSFVNGFADGAGVVSALFPMLAQKVRQRF